MPVAAKEFIGEADLQLDALIINPPHLVCFLPSLFIFRMITVEGVVVSNKIIKNMTAHLPLSHKPYSL